MRHFVLSIMAVLFCLSFVSCSKDAFVTEDNIGPDAMICSTLESNYVDIEIVSTDILDISLYGKSGRKNVHFTLCNDASSYCYGKYVYSGRVDCSLICYKDKYYQYSADAGIDAGDVNSNGYRTWKYFIAGVFTYDVNKHPYSINLPSWCTRYSVIEQGSDSVHIDIQVNW